LPDEFLGDLYITLMVLADFGDDESAAAGDVCDVH
jgi:hypothetical protein